MSEQSKKNEHSKSLIIVITIINVVMLIIDKETINYLLNDEGVQEFLKETEK
jgi:hypothetical protein